MIGTQGLSLVEVDRQASAEGAPYCIVTADCSSPKEIDDGVFVEPLDTDQEAYRVGVCVVDSSDLYDDPEIRQQAMDRTEATYFPLPDDESGYDPMIDLDVIADHQLTKGKVRSALIVSFVVGKAIAPSDVQIGFGHVEVAENYNYKEFWRKAAPHEPLERYARASALIVAHLRDNHPGEPMPHSRFRQIYNGLAFSSRGGWYRGAEVNRTYMIAANHLVGQAMAAEGRPAIYRVHDSTPKRGRGSNDVVTARFSSIPGRHAGLDLDVYSRVTSPLRRLEDFVMNHHLRQRFEGRDVTAQEIADLQDAISRLNTKIALRGVSTPEAWDEEQAGEFATPLQVAAETA